MLLFWLLAALMTLVALAFVLVPLVRARSPGTAPSEREANLAVLRGQRREIDTDVANGTLPADARDEALAELVDRAEADLEALPPPAPAPARRPWPAVAAAAVAVPALAFGMYLATGNPTAADAQLVAHEGSPMTEAQIVAMVDNLARKVRERPDDVQGWALLGRSMAALGRFPEAADAYAHLLKLAPDDPDVLTEYADVLGMTQGRSLAGRPTELVRKALQIAPNNGKALALAGTAAFDAGDFGEAARYWQSLAAGLPAGSEERTQVETVIGEARAKALAAGQALPAPLAAAAKAEPPAQAAAGASVTGSVALAPQVAAKVRPSDTLFIFARAESGPRMPLAVVRGTAADLPKQFALDDSQAMSPAFKLSSAAAVRVEARISRSGNAIPQPGDLVGSSDVVKPGAHGLKILIDKVVP